MGAGGAPSLLSDQELPKGSRTKEQSQDQAPVGVKYLAPLVLNFLLPKLQRNQRITLPTGVPATKSRSCSLMPGIHSNKCILFTSNVSEPREQVYGRSGRCQELYQGHRSPHRTHSLSGNKRSSIKCVAFMQLRSPKTLLFQYK